MSPRPRARVVRARKTPRDQEESAFTPILGALVASVPGARAAALIDAEGETVDYAGCEQAFSTRVAAAHWRVVLSAAHACPIFRDVKWISTRAAGRSYLLYALPEGYALVMILSRAAGLVACGRAIVAGARLIAEEAGFERRRAGLALLWRPVEVISDSSRRPKMVRVGEKLHSVEILGRLEDGRTLRRDKGWRVRVGSRIEATLVREAGGSWYVDELLGGLDGL